MLTMTTPGRLLSDYHTIRLTVGVTTYQAQFKTVADALDALDCIKQAATSQGFRAVQ
jgi:hypothetical protein